MAQSAMTIANQEAPQFRAALNTALLALISNSSGATEPTTTYANMFWFDTANSQLKVRTQADDAWIIVGTFNQTTRLFSIPSTALAGFFNITVASANYAANSNLLDGFDHTAFARYNVQPVWEGAEIYIGDTDHQFGTGSVIVPDGHGIYRVFYTTGTNRMSYYVRRIRQR